MSWHSALMALDPPHVLEGVEMLTVLGVLGAWIALQWWVLPRLGVPT
jgi:hypothetical protein